MRLLPAVLILLIASWTASSQTYTISTFAGGGLPTNLLGTSASLSGPQSVAVDNAGNVFFADREYVMRLDGTTSVLTIVAGNGIAGFSSDNGPATSAALFVPQGVAVDSSGSLYIADVGNNRIRKVSNGIITTVAGKGSPGLGGDGGPATDAQLNLSNGFFATGIAVDARGNLYIADCSNNRIREVPNGVIVTVAGSGSVEPGFFSGDGGPATNAQLNRPSGVAVDASGNIFIADTLNDRIREVTSGGITTVAGGGPGPGLGDNGSATSALLEAPAGLAVDSTGNLYVADYFNSRVRKISAGIITTIAGTGSSGFGGDGGSAVSAPLGPAQGVAVNSTGNVYIADTPNARIRKVANGTIDTVAGNGAPYDFSGDNVPATTTQLFLPQDVAADYSGNLYIADTDNNRVRKVANGIITTVAGTGTAGFGGDNGPAANAELDRPLDIAVDSSGDIFIADAGNDRVRKVSNGVITTVAGNGSQGFSGDGGPAISAQFFSIIGVAVDTAGNLYIADSFSRRIREVSNGVITTVAGDGVVGFGGDGGPATSAQFFGLNGVAVDAGGDIYISDGSRVREVSNGIITTVAGNATLSGFSGDGGVATSAELYDPTGLAVDSAGNLYIADTGNNRLRSISSGIITTLAGGGTADLGDNGPATDAELNGPEGVTVDSAGNIYFADYNSNRVRLLASLRAGAQQPQTITFLPPAAVTLPAAPFALNATASSGLQVTFVPDTASVCTVSGVDVTLVGAGTCSITATQAGNASFSPAAPVTQSFTVNRAGLASQTISFGALSNLPASSAPFGLTATASSNLAVTFTSNTPSVCTVSGSTVTTLISGVCSITASQFGSSVYAAAAPVTQTFTVSAPPPPLQLLTVAPCRIMDTRTPAAGGTFPANNTFGSPYIAAGAVRAIPIPSSTCGVSASAMAYSLNFTVVPRTGKVGSLTVWPAGQTQPNVSTLTSPDGSVLAAAAIVPAGTAGSINAISTDDTDLVVDINGYFAPPTTGTLQFYPLPPCRVLDTRLISNGGSFPPNSTFGSPSLYGGSGRSYPIPSSSCGAPASAAAYSFNLTAVPQGALGYVTAWPTGQTQPFVSTMNSYDGTVLANAAIVPAGTAGAVRFFASNPTDLAVDINGYFAPPGSGGLNFYTLTPCRLMDTRNANGTFGGPTISASTTRNFPLPQASCGFPAPPAAEAYSLSVTVFPQGGPLGYLTTWPTGGTQPFVSTLNAYKGLAVANAALVPAGTGGSISVFVTNTTDLTIDTAGYFGP